MTIAKRSLILCFSSLFLLLGHAWANSLSPITDPSMVAAINSSAPPQWTLTWGVPQHLLDGGFLEGTDAASSIEFRDADGVNRATVLAIRTHYSATNPVGVYPHDYRRCSSIHGRELVSISSQHIRGGWYLLVHMMKHAINEYEMSYIVEDLGSGYRIDSELFADLYSPATNGNVFNFQIWANSPAITEEILEDITSYLEGVKPTSYSNDTSTPTPDATVNYVGVQGGELDLAVWSDEEVSAEFAVVVWTYPNPNPEVRYFTRTLQEGVQPVLLDLPSADDLATDFEVYLAINAQGEDGVLAAVNHFGHYSSGWIPFSGPGSTVAVVAVADHPTSLPEPDEDVYIINDSDIHLNGSLALNSWCGAFIDLIPEIEDNPLSFEAFDALRFHAKRVNGGALTNYEVKLETTAGINFKENFQVTDVWQDFELPLSGFVGDGGQAWSGTEEVARIVLAAVSSVPSEASLGISDMAVSRPPQRRVSSIGEGGRVVITPGGEVCEDYSVLSLPKSTPVTLTPQVDPGYKFYGWTTEDSEPCHAFQLEEDRSCKATFAPLYETPVVTIEAIGYPEGQAPNTTRFLLADNNLNHLDWTTLEVTANSVDITLLFLAVAPSFYHVDPEFTRIMIDIPFIYPDKDFYIYIRRKAAYGGQSASFFLENGGV
ncbi:MAG: hypothetical protein ABIK28_09840 [Planctomycetota bacterium]